MSNTLSNQHFGRHVFEYFPWYSYSDFPSDPILNENIYKSLRDSLDATIWIREGNFYFGGDLYDRKKISLNGSKVYYLGIEETVNDWEDVEKIRLRLILGTEEKAHSHMKIIDFYNKYIGLISDMVYSQVGEDIDIPLIDLQDFVYRDIKEVCINNIENDDVYDAMMSGNFKRNKFTSSLKEYYEKKGFLTYRQIESLKEFSYREILKNKNLIFFMVKTNRITNKNRMVEYMNLSGLKCDIYDDYLLIKE